MISTGELKKGVAIELDGELWQILDYHHIKMGRGSAQVRITLRNIKRGQTVERSFQAGTKWPRASMEKRPVQFLYHEGDDYHFMDTDTYDQFVLTTDQLGEAAQYMKDGMTLDRTSYQGETIGVELPVTRRPRSSARPSPASPATRRPVPASRRRPRRASSSRSRSSSRRATRSASTPGPASTRPGSEPAMAGRGGIDALLDLMDEAFRGAGIEESNESQALLTNLASVPETQWRGRCRRSEPLDRVDRRSTSARARSCTTTTHSAAGTLQFGDTRGRAVRVRRARRTKSIAWLEARMLASWSTSPPCATTRSSTRRG